MKFFHLSKILASSSLHHYGVVVMKTFCSPVHHTSSISRFFGTYVVKVSRTRKTRAGTEARSNDRVLSMLRKCVGFSRLT